MSKKNENNSYETKLTQQPEVDPDIQKVFEDSNITKTKRAESHISTTPANNEISEEFKSTPPNPYNEEYCKFEDINYGHAFVMQVRARGPRRIYIKLDTTNPIGFNALCLRDSRLTNINPDTLVQCINKLTLDATIDIGEGSDREELMNTSINYKKSRDTGKPLSNIGTKTHTHTKKSSDDGCDHCGECHEHCTHTSGTDKLDRTILSHLVAKTNHIDAYLHELVSIMKDAVEKLIPSPYIPPKKTEDDADYADLMASLDDVDTDEDNEQPKKPLVYKLASDVIRTVARRIGYPIIENNLKELAERCVETGQVGICVSGDENIAMIRYLGLDNDPMFKVDFEPNNGTQTWVASDDTRDVVVAILSDAQLVEDDDDFIQLVDQAATMIKKHGKAVIKKKDAAGDIIMKVIITLNETDDEHKFNVKIWRRSDKKKDQCLGIRPFEI